MRLSVYLREQEVAGLDIVTDGDCRFDQDVGGQSWTSYPPHHMEGFDATHPKLAAVNAGGIGFPRGHILHDYLEARVMPRIVGPLGRGEMQYAEIWKAAQRLTQKPVKFGTVTPELVAFAVQDEPLQEPPRSHHGDERRVQRRSCTTWRTPAARSSRWRSRRSTCWPRASTSTAVINPEFMLKVFNNTVKGLRAKTEVWCHTCWGNPSQQRMFAEVQTYKPALKLLNQVDADVITFEMASSNAMDLEDVGREITEKKVVIGAIDHHTLQVESPAEVADAGAPGAEAHSRRSG